MAGLATPESIVVPDKMLEGAGIEVIVDEVTHVDAAQKRLELSKGGALEYDKLFLAMGASSFLPPIEGLELSGVLSLRGLADAQKIKDFMAEKNPGICCLWGRDSSAWKSLRCSHRQGMARNPLPS